MLLKAGNWKSYRDTKHKVPEKIAQNLAHHRRIRVISEMSDTLQMALALSALGLLLVKEERKQMQKTRRKCTKWVKPWILQRQAQGAFPNLCRELELAETSDLKNFALLFPIQLHMLK